ncbi:MAG: isoprenylcysteine carboxylmethyltransferase family protein [Candidatus Omnitrophica bacterium]|nr:isoprenylcysteine carboxylmethyltransferase family protein [Candidatus Omnitrophota bacterium]
MSKFFDYFQIAGLTFFISVFTGITSYLFLIKRINPFTIIIGKKGMRLIVEIFIFVGIVLWIIEVFLHALHLNLRIFPSFLDIQLINSTPLKFTGIIFVTTGFVVYTLGLAVFRSSWRMAIDEKNPGKLITKGIFSCIRNPIFTFFNFYFIGTFLINGSLIFLLFAIFIAVNLHYQILHEEKTLLKIYGQAYQDYCAKASRYFISKLVSSKNNRKS